MPRFTTQNAAEMQRRSLATRLERKAAERTALASDCKRRLKSAAGGARKVLHPPGKADWI